MHCPNVGTKLSRRTDPETFFNCAVHFLLNGTSWMSSCAAASLDFSGDPDVSHPHLSRPGLLRLLEGPSPGEKGTLPCAPVSGVWSALSYPDIRNVKHLGSHFSSVTPRTNLSILSALRCLRYSAL